MFSLSEAAKQSGQSKSTIWRAIKAGRVSATRIDGGDYQIEAELYRVFPPGTAAERAGPVSLKHDATGVERDETALLRAEIDNLRQIGEMLRGQLEDVKQDRDAWRGQAQAGTLLLTHGAPPAKTGWLRRLVG
jgi:excisionase family DNA binding protein